MIAERPATKDEEAGVISTVAIHEIRLFEDHLKVLRRLLQVPQESTGRIVFDGDRKEIIGSALQDGANVSVGDTPDVGPRIGNSPGGRRGGLKFTDLRSGRNP